MTSQKYEDNQGGIEERKRIQEEIRRLEQQLSVLKVKEHLLVEQYGHNRKAN